jgi:hypothetical protein
MLQTSLLDGAAWNTAWTCLLDGTAPDQHDAAIDMLSGMMRDADRHVEEVFKHEKEVYDRKKAAVDPDAREKEAMTAGDEAVALYKDRIAKRKIAEIAEIEEVPITKPSSEGSSSIEVRDDASLCQFCLSLLSLASQDDILADATDEERDLVLNAPDKGTKYKLLFGLCDKYEAIAGESCVENLRNAAAARVEQAHELAQAASCREWEAIYRKYFNGIEFVLELRKSIRCLLFG